MKHHTLLITYNLQLTTYFLTTYYLQLTTYYFEFVTCQNCPTHYQMLSIMTIAHLHMKLKSAIWLKTLKTQK